MKKYITDILSNTIEINKTQRTIQTYLDDKGNEFLTIFYDENMFIDYGQISIDETTITIDFEKVEKIVKQIQEREEEL